MSGLSFLGTGAKPRPASQEKKVVHSPQVSVGHSTCGKRPAMGQHLPQRLNRQGTDPGYEPRSKWHETGSLA